MLTSYMDVTQVENTPNAAHRDSMKELESRGVTIFSASKLSPNLGLNHNSDKFAGYWDDLEPDKFMQDKGLYRKRRFGRYRYNTKSSSLSVIGGEHEFYQSEKINQLNGGKRRKFALASANFANERILNGIVKHCVKIISIKKSLFESLTINTHLIRIVCGRGIVGLPTPEGIHRDGHCFVSQHLINRKNVYGGVSGIYNLNDEPVVHCQLFNFMDSILINDGIVKHDVSPVYSADKTNEGYRDMLIIDYNFT